MSNPNTLNGSISNGIVLTSAGSYQSPFTIDIGGTIDTTGSYGVYSDLSTATLVNEGAVTAADVGVLLNPGAISGPGVVSNVASASIHGAADGVEIFSTNATLTNDGLISTHGTSSIGSLLGDAVYIAGQGEITNAAGATIISAYGTGIEGNRASIAGDALTVTNDGVIIAEADETSRFCGISLRGDGFVTNGDSATIAGAVGVDIDSYGSILNDGTIIGSVASTQYLNVQNGVVLGYGTLSNSSTGLIEGAYEGIRTTNATINNSGMIEGQLAGIDAFGDATITNSASASIHGETVGVSIRVTDADLINQGLIDADQSFAVQVGGGTITNDVGATITSQNGIAVYSDSSAATTSLTNDGVITGTAGVKILGDGNVQNQGIITGTSGYGVLLSGGGYLSNSVSASIYGAAVGIEATGNATITNSGTIESVNSFGINLEMAGSVNNAGMIEGSNVGVVVQNGSGAATIVNAGTISGYYAVYFGNTTGNTLIVDPGAVFSGQVGGHNAGNLLELTSGTSAGTIDSDSFSGFTTIDVDAGADWTLTGTDGELADNVGAAGTVSLAANSTLNVTGNIGADQTIVFAGDHATLGINVNSTISGTIDLDTTSGEFQTIDIAGLAFSSMPSGSFDTSTDVLTIGYVGDPPETLNFNSPDAANYMLEDDGAGGTDVVIPCFVTDTRILTTRGYLPVQNLRVGDRVVTVREGGPASAEIIWLGERTVDCEALAAPETGWPVLVSRGALGHNMPARDLWVSRDHCLMVDNVLIPARELVNGTSIRQVPRARVTYWHVELPSHDIMLAEGMPAESYLDTGNRTAFAQPDVAAGTPHHWSDTCLPIVFGDTAQAHLARQLGAVA